MAREAQPTADSGDDDVKRIRKMAAVGAKPSRSWAAVRPRFAYDKEQITLRKELTRNSHKLQLPTQIKHDN